MAKAAPRDDRPRTVAEFEAWHARRPEKWEFIAGQPRLMAPGSMKYTILKGNVFRALDRALAGTPCHVLTEGAQILTADISAIPDAVVTCAPVDLTTPVVREPALIVEVMSPSSEADDTGRKWFAYQKIPSLRHYLVISQERREVAVHSRAGGLWRERFATAGEAIDLEDPPVVLEIDALYAATDVPG
jgi:Uma2 family endonuclease